MFINEPKVVVESEDDPEDEASLAMCSNLLILEIVDNNVAIISSLLRFNWNKTENNFQSFEARASEYIWTNRIEIFELFLHNSFILLKNWKIDLEIGKSI